MSAKKYRILAFCPYYPPHIGGLEKYAEELHENLADAGHEITVITPNIPLQDQYSSYPGVRVIRFPAFEIVAGYPFPKFWHKSFWTYFMSINNEKFDITLSTTRFFITSVMALVLSKTKRIPWFHIEHGSDYIKSDSNLITIVGRVIDETLGRLIFSLSTANIAPSQSAQRFMARFNSRKTKLIYRGFPWDQVNSISPNLKIRDKYQDKTIVTFAGRLFSGKGVNDLIKAVSLLRQQNIVLLIIGDGPVKKNLETQVNRLSINSTVSFLGQKTFEETIAVIKSSDIIINPSYNEGLPTSILEAAACQVGIIATDVGGTSEIISHNESGLLISPGNPKLIAMTLKKLISNPSLRKSLGINAKKSVKNKFSWPLAISKYEDIFA